VLAARNESPPIRAEGEETSHFFRYIWMVPTATAAVLVFGAVETGGFALFPIYGSRIGYSEADAALLLTMIGLGNVVLQIPMGMLSDRMRDRRHLLLACAAVGLLGTAFMPFFAQNWHLMALLLFLWGGVVAAMYTVGLAHLGSQLSGHELASANAAFVLCYGVGMVLGPQAIGIGMDAFGPSGFGWSLALFFGVYMVLAAARLAMRRSTT
jgi:predicted MFS family arabinose efflux permease